jgi:hypothetical protein
VALRCCSVSSRSLLPRSGGEVPYLLLVASRRRILIERVARFVGHPGGDDRLVLALPVQVSPKVLKPAVKPSVLVLPVTCVVQVVEVVEEHLKSLKVDVVMEAEFTFSENLA